MKLSKFLLAAGLFVLPMFGLNLQAQIGVTWNPGNVPSGNWNVPGNWGGTVPITGYKAFFNVPNVGACIVSDTEGGCQISIGDGGPGVLIVTNGGNLSAGDTQIPGGSLSNNGWTGVGTSTNSTGTLIVAGGTVTFAYHCWIGLNAGATGSLIVNSGLASVTNSDPMAGPPALGIGTGGGSGSVTLNGGTLQICNAHLQLPHAGPQINLAGGTLQFWYFNGNSSDTWDAFVTSGQIVGYGGSGTVHVDLSNPNYAALTGVGGSILPSSSQITFTSVQSGGHVTLIYNSTVSAPYHIESTPSLSAPSWTTVSGSSTNASSTSTTFTFTDPATRDFYRIVSP